MVVINRSLKKTEKSKRAVFNSLIEGSLTELTEDDLSDITVIRTQAFYNLPLTKISIPDSITEIGDYAFCGTKITDVVIPASVQTLGKSALSTSGTVLISANISAKTIGSYATTGDVSYVVHNNPTTTTLILGEGVEIISDNAFYNCNALAGTLVFPETLQSMGAKSFYGCSSLAAIELKSSTPPTLSNTNAFTSCTKLATIYIPSGSLEAYQSATNWSNFSAKFVEKE